MAFRAQPHLTGKPGTEAYSSGAYRDYSTYLQNGGELIKHKKSDRNFPVKLHLIVSDPSNSLVITWMPHGRAFKVLKKDELVRDVIPGYFECAKFESLTRQLTAWDFRRCKRGPDQGCYYHEAFLRGLPELTCFIRRMPRNSRKSDRQIIEPQDEPDFRRLSSLHPVPPSHSTQEEGSSARRKLDSNEQAGGMRDDEKLGDGEDGMREGHMGDDFSSVSGSSPPHCHNHGEYHQHDQHEEGHRLGASAPLEYHGEYQSTEYHQHDQHEDAAATSESQSWGGVRPSSHHYDPNHWSAPGLGIECPPHGPGARTSDYQYNATPQHYRPPEQSHSSPHHHFYGYGHGNYGYYAPPGHQHQGYAQADMYNHYNSPHYHPSHQPYYHYPHSYYHPPPDYPAYNGQWHRPNQTHNQHDTYHYYQTSATGTLEEEADQDKQSR